MSAKHNPTINVTKVSDLGTLPGYIDLAHRQFQKTLPVGEKKENGEVHYTVPTDLLAMVLPQGEVDKIEEVTFVYAKPQ